MRKYLLGVLCFCGLFVLCSELLTAGEFYIVDGRKIEVSLEVDKGAIMLGEPTSFSYIVKNHSEDDLQVIVGGDYRNGLGRPDSFRISVHNEVGEGVAQLKTGFCMGGFVGPKKIPAKGDYTFKLFLPHWATFSETGEYTIVAKRILAISLHGSENWMASQKRKLTFNKPEAVEDIELGKMSVLAHASAKIEVQPLNKVTMGEIIAGFGNRMLQGKGDDVDSARRALSYIEDERVIPYFLKALEMRNYSQKFGALSALGKFNNDAAFEGLKLGMDTWEEDLGSSSDNIRHCAANALARSPHPDAISFLLTRRDDPSRAVRLTIVQASKKMKRADAFSLLEEMKDDKDDMVRGEAQRYFKMLFPVSRNPSE